MRTSLALLLLASLSSLAGCADTIGGLPSADSGVLVDTTTPSDGGVGPMDTGLIEPRDAGSPRDSGGLPLDTGVPVDRPRPTDRPLPSDQGVPPMQLASRYRLVRYYVRTPEGFTLDLSDRDGPIEQGDPSQVYRVNGVLTLTDTEFSLSVAVLVNGHAFADEGTSGPDDYSAQGITYPGTLDRAGGRFTFAGGVQVANFAQGADGRVVLRFLSENDAFYELEPATQPTPVLQYSAGGVVQSVDGPIIMAPNFRVALFWDLPDSTMVLEDRAALVSSSEPFAPYFVSYTGAPTEAACGNRFGLRLCIAHIAAYVDGNSNGRYDVGEPVLGVSPLMLSWMEALRPTEAFLASPFRYLSRGWEVSHRHEALGRGGDVLTPFDGTAVLQPDLPLYPGMTQMALPNVW